MEQSGPDFQPAYLQTGNVRSIFGRIDTMFFILIVSLHSKAGLTAVPNQYLRSKDLVLCVYRSTRSAGRTLLPLHILITFSLPAT